MRPSLGQEPAASGHEFVLPTSCFGRREIDSEGMISVVVVNWNSGPLVEQCVRSLWVHAAGCEIVLVDNASDDGSLDFLSKREHILRLHRNGQNLGFAAASNIGWRLCHGDPVLFLNPDAQCTEGAVPRLAETLLDDESVWAAGGLLTDPAGKAQRGFNVRAFPTIASLAAEMLLLEEIWPGNPWTRRYRMSGWDHSKITEVDQPAGACLMVRRRILERLGGFDEAFRPAWFEDVDLCKRIRNDGGRILFQPAARFLHQGGVSLRRISWYDFLRHYHGNQLRYFTKHCSPGSAAKARRLIVAGLRLRAWVSRLAPVAPGTSRLQSVQLYGRVARQISLQRGGTG
jgi:GT2 family glycosyltransferase